MEAAEAEMAAHRGIPAGLLRVGCSPDIARDVLTPNLHQFLELYPNIDLRVRVGERLMPEPSKIDIVLHSGWLSDLHLTVRKLATIKTLLVASRGYVQRYGLPRTPDDMVDHIVLGNFYFDQSAIEPDQLPAYVPLLEIVRGQKRFPLPIWSRFVSTDHWQMLEIVRNGLAIAPISLYRALPELHSGELIHILPQYKVHNPPTLHALYADRIAAAPKLKVFLDYVREIIAHQRASLSRQSDG